MCVPPISGMWSEQRIDVIPKPFPGRWLIDLEGLRDVDICNAYADAQSTSYPGAAEEGQKGAGPGRAYEKIFVKYMY